MRALCVHYAGLMCTVPVCGESSNALAASRAGDGRPPARPEGGGRRSDGSGLALYGGRETQNKAVSAAALLTRDGSGFIDPRRFGASRATPQGRRREHATGGKAGFELATDGIQLYDVTD